jgi:hypothetical protein
MAPETTDPTAGRRARDIRRDPTTPQPILDPTDPRYGPLQPDPATPPLNLDTTHTRRGARTRQRRGPGHVNPRSW